MKRFWREVEIVWWKWAQRRSQRGRKSWDTLKVLMKRYALPPPRSNSPRHRSMSTMDGVYGRPGRPHFGSRWFVLLTGIARCDHGVVMQLAIDYSACSRPAVAVSSTSSWQSNSTLPPEVRARDEVQRLLDGLLGRNERTRTRNRALLVVMCRAGLRVSEALGLRMDDLRPDEGGVWVRRGKGGKPRLTGMGPESFEALRP